MTEYIEREAAIKAAEHAWDEWNLAMAAADGKREINLVYKRQELCKAVASVFDSAPAADVAPVIRCKDCKYHHWEQEPCHGRTEHFCTLFDGLIEVTRDSFCSCGERGDKGEKQE